MFSFVKTKLFTRLVQDYLNDDQYRELQAFLMEQPDGGDVIPGSGGFANFVGVLLTEANAAVSE